MKMGGAEPRGKSSVKPLGGVLHQSDNGVPENLGGLSQISLVFRG